MTAERTREGAIERRPNLAKYRIKAIQIGCGTVICLIFCYLALIVVWGSSENISFDNRSKTEAQQTINDQYGQDRPAAAKRMIEQSDATWDQVIRSDTRLLSVGSSMLFLGLILLSFIVLMISDLMTRWDDEKKRPIRGLLKGTNSAQNR
jgi:hypothetical protein